MNRPLIALALVLTALAAHAEAASPIGGATTRRDPLTVDPLGPRSEPTVTVATAVARNQIEQGGYSSVRGLKRTQDGLWHAVARDSRNAPVAVTLDGQGKVTQMQ